MSQIILHIDMDAFFAAIEQLDFPDLRGKPVIVCADPKQSRGRGVVSTASYEARKFGVHSAMPISQAYQRCPQGIFVPPRMRRYAEMSRQVMSLLADFSPLVEQLSIDEAFIDFTGTLKIYGSPETIGKKVKLKILTETHLTCSVGIAPNKFVAKIASDLEKPDGLVLVPEDGVGRFLNPLPIAKMWGVGKKTEPILAKMGIHTIGDLAAMPQKVVTDRLGKWGLHFWLLAQGIDNRSVENHRMAQKSLSQETTFDTDVADVEVMHKTLFCIADDLARLLRRHRLKGKTVTLKIRFEDFSTFTRSQSVRKYIDGSDEIRQIAFNLFDAFDRQKKKVRLLGISVSKLSHQDTLQLDLFDATQALEHKIDRIIDIVRERHGPGTLERASAMGYHSRWYRNTDEPDSHNSGPTHTED